MSTENVGQPRYPSARRVADALVVELAPGEATAETWSRCVLDYAEYGDVIGIEIVGLQDAAVGPHPISVTEIEAGPIGAHVAYDQEADALFVMLEHGRSVLNAVPMRYWC